MYQNIIYLINDSNKVECIQKVKIKNQTKKSKYKNNHQSRKVITMSDSELIPNPVDSTPVSLSPIAPVVPSDFQIKSVYDIDLSSENDEDLFDDDLSFLPQALRSKDLDVVDKLWKAHRTCRIGKTGDKIEWSFPTSSKEREELKGQTAFSELMPVPSHHFVGMRGIPIGFRYGFKLTEGEAADSKVICTTSKMEEFNGETLVRKIDDRYPMEIPIGQPHKSKAEPNSPSYALQTQYEAEQRMVVYGSRPPIGKTVEESHGKVRSCLECIEAGEHYLGTEEDIKAGVKTNICSRDGYFLFVVFQLAILDASDLFDDPINNRVKLKWVTVEEANIRTKVGDSLVQLKRPFVIKLQGITKTQDRSIGKGEYERDVILRHEDNQCYLPSEVYSAGDYYKYINHRDGYGTRYRKLKGGSLSYLQVTELYTGKLRAQEYGLSHIPVFSPCNDPEIISAGNNWTGKDWAISALKIVQLEQNMANGKVKEGELEGAKAAIPLPSVVAPSIQPVDEPVVPVASEVPVKAQNKKFAAFKATT